MLASPTPSRKHILSISHLPPNYACVPFTPLTPLTPFTPLVCGSSYLSQFANTAPIFGEFVNRYTSSKYSFVSSKGRAVTLGMYFPINLLGSIVVLLIFLRR